MRLLIFTLSLISFLLPAGNSWSALESAAMPAQSVVRTPFGAVSGRWNSLLFASFKSPELREAAALSAPALPGILKMLDRAQSRSNAKPLPFETLRIFMPIISVLLEEKHLSEKQWLDMDEPHRAAILKAALVSAGGLVRKKARSLLADAVAANMDLTGLSKTVASMDETEEFTYIYLSARDHKSFRDDFDRYRIERGNALLAEVELAASEWDSAESESSAVTDDLPKSMPNLERRAWMSLGRERKVIEDFHFERLGHNPADEVVLVTEAQQTVENMAVSAESAHIKAQAIDLFAAKVREHADAGQRKVFLESVERIWNSMLSAVNIIPAPAGDPN